MPFAWPVPVPTVSLLFARRPRRSPSASAMNASRLNAESCISSKLSFTNGVAST
jgi:hypothetical protein